MKMKDSTPLCVSCGNHFEMDSYGAMNKVGVATKQTTNAPEKSLVGNSIKPSSYDEAKLELVEPPVMLDPYRNSADISKSNSTDPSRLIGKQIEFISLLIYFNWLFDGVDQPPNYFRVGLC